MSKKYEVEVTFIVAAKDEDDAVFKLRAWLDKQEVTLDCGVRSYHTYDDCATKHEPEPLSG